MKTKVLKHKHYRKIFQGLYSLRKIFGGRLLLKVSASNSVSKIINPMYSIQPFSFSKNSQLTQAGTPAQLLGMIRKQFDENWCTCFSFINYRSQKLLDPKKQESLAMANRNWKPRNSWSFQGKAMLKIWWKSMLRFKSSNL